MQLITLLNQLDAAGTLGRLYRAGAVTMAVYSQREIYNTYHALLSSPHYLDRPSKAAAATAASCQVGRRTVYRALRCMEQQVADAPALAGWG